MSYSHIHWLPWWSHCWTCFCSASRTLDTESQRSHGRTRARGDSARCLVSFARLPHTAPPTHSNCCSEAHHSHLSVHYWPSPLPSLPNHSSIHAIQIVLLKMEAVHSFETVEHTSSTWHIHPKDNRQLKTLHTSLTLCLLSAFKCISVWCSFWGRVP